MVECNLAKVDVAGSNPVSRSIFVFTAFDLQDRSFGGPLAQLVEQGTLNPKVGGSTPSRPTIFLTVDNPAAGLWRVRRTHAHGASDSLEPGRVAELADALDLGSSIVRCAGSSPASPTNPTIFGARPFSVPVAKATSIDSE